MTTYSTGNPIGSMAPKDLFDNAENLDHLVNSQSAETWVDRLGKARKTWHGVLKQAQLDIGLAVSEATAEAEGYRDESKDARDDAIAAASASGDFIFVKDLEEMQSKLPQPDEKVFEVAADADHDHARTRYVVIDGAPVFVVNLDRLRQDLATPLGSGRVGFQLPGVGSVPRTVQDKLADMPVDARDCGAVCDGVADDTIPLLKAVELAKARGSALTGKGNCRVTGTVDFREVILELGAMTISVDHEFGPGIILGGNANSADNPDQVLRKVVRISGVDSSDTPAIRAIGVKGQYIKVGRTPYFQVYATDLADRSGYSSAYSTFDLSYANVIELKSQPGTLGWVNENYFYVNRCHTIKTADGLYGHNHNKFVGGTMEGVGLIDMPVGGSNFFYGFRFERTIVAGEKLTVNFGPLTNNNHIEVTWVSSPGFSNSIYGFDLLDIHDQGSGNTLSTAQEDFSDDIVLFALGQATGLLSCVNKQTVGYNAYTTDLVGVGAIQQNFRGSYRIMQAGARMYTQESGLIAIRKGDMFAYMSDKPNFRFLMRCYDANRRLITSRPAVDPVAWAGITWVSAQAAYSVTANSERRTMLAVDASVVKYVQFDITTGTGTNGLDFEEFRFIMRRGKYASYGPRDYASMSQPKRKTTLQYNNDADIDMWRIAEGLECIRYDNKQRRINTFRRERFVTAVSGSVLSVVPLGVMVFWVGALLYYEDSAGGVQSLSVTAADNGTITVSGALPADIVPGVKVLYVLTQTVTTP
ncbi:hypothetical protein F3J24_17155 [Comamonas sp. Tr-654]|uniref:hypothetical protein n=1 Tax=Comamonas sp. Tr-654 TaxID=2608341 RepID=UPI00141EE6EA|nr:hypothetical protein [Comamonas sp. Tr-654]NIF85242.1 hypothetical protein [Comamonas sp. Tr-654]